MKKDERVGKAAIRDALAERPWTAVRGWAYPLVELGNYEAGEGHDIEREALKLFEKFTVCMWHYLDVSAVRSDMTGEFEGVEDVLRKWTLPWAMDNLIHPQLVAIEGLSREAFVSKMSILFPAPGSVLQGGWKAMEESYLGEYWRVIGERSDEDAEKIEKALGKLLSYCQCLPNSKPRGPWTSGKGGEVQLIVNPGEYHDEI